MTTVMIDPQGVGGHPEEVEGSRKTRRGSGRSWQLDVLALVGFLALSVYAAWPLTAEIVTSLPCHHIDPLLNVWMFSWAAYAIVYSSLRVFGADIFYPDQLTFAYTETSLGQSLPLTPIYWLTGNGVLTVKIALLLLYGVGGFGAYLLAREISVPRSGTFVGGVAFGLSPYRLKQIVHNQGGGPPGALRALVARPPGISPLPLSRARSWRTSEVVADGRSNHRLRGRGFRSGRWLRYRRRSLPVLWSARAGSQSLASSLFLCSSPMPKPAPCAPTNTDRGGAR